MPRSVTSVCSLILALSFLLARDAGAVTVRMVCPRELPEVGQPILGELIIDAGAHPLGAYTVIVTYDSEVMRIASIAGGRTAEFSALPVSNDADYATGQSRVAAFNGSSLSSPTGVVSVAKITLLVIAAPQSAASVGVQVLTLTDTSGTRLVSESERCTLQTGTGTPEPTLSPAFTPDATSPIPTVTPTLGVCAGDCDGDGQVLVNELVLGVNLALGSGQGVCRALDQNADGRISIEELVRAVTRALRGCSPQSSSQ